MNLTYELVYLAGGSKKNEDAYVTRESNRVFAAIDGATGLGGLSGKIAAQLVKTAFEQMPGNSSLFEAIKDANILIERECLKALELTSIDELPKEMRSSCGIAAVKINKNHLEYLHTGDCMIFIEYANGETHHLSYDHLSKLDSVSIHHYHQAISARLGTPKRFSHWSQEEISNLLKDAREEILPLIIQNRRKLNTEEGYGVLDGSVEALEFLSTGRTPLQDATRILLLSDGLQLPTRKASGISSWHLTAEYAFENGLDALKEKVSRMEVADKLCYKYPRLKYSDDKTGILINLGRST